MTAGARLGVDVGGTFTDLVLLRDGQLVTAKVPSTPADQSEGVLSAVQVAGVSDVVAFAHGMTVATNALLERRGARTALVTTEGFRDLLEIGRQNRPSLYDLSMGRPRQLVPRELRFCVRERMGPGGVIEPLDEQSLHEVVAALRSAGVEAVAVCLLFGFLHPAHERRVGEAIRAALPSVHVSLSSAVLPEVREYERCSTVTADAYLGPKLGAYLANLGDRAVAAGLPEPLIMQSSGGVTELTRAANLASACVLSGPAGGVVGAAYAGRESGYADLLSFDMGGTSTDVAPIVGGVCPVTTGAEVAGVPIRHPMVDVHTVSAGGGSIAARDAGGALRVGPESAGAVPGPAAYGRGGDRATVTDANLYLGRLEDGARLGSGEVQLSRAYAERALEQLGDELHLTAQETALGVIRVANAEMARALRVVSVERGLDPRRFALAAFGGAGAMHACALAEELGIATILVPEAGGVLSALGLAISDLRQDLVQALPAPLTDAISERVEEGFGELEARARASLEGPALRLERQADLRYRHQAFELTVAADDVSALASNFHAAHQQRYGYATPEQPVELVSLRMVATLPVDKPVLDTPPADSHAPAKSRRVHTGAAWETVPVHVRANMGAGSRVAGPSVIELAGATAWVAPGWSGEIDSAGALVLTCRES
ncbi:MAG: hydantoinase/oxoprolinase family protein [Actinomycetota bacterium]|nr:hydantoinase/oxoprolinase family protein [Actinomycetota bacterium]